MKLSIYTGHQTPAVAVGKHQCHFLEFAEKNRGWHAMPESRARRAAIYKLRDRGCMMVTEDGTSFKFHRDEPVRATCCTTNGKDLERHERTRKEIASNRHVDEKESRRLRKKHPLPPEVEAEIAATVGRMHQPLASGMTLKKLVKSLSGPPRVLPPGYFVGKTVTGRFSGSKINLSNGPKRDRARFYAPKGKTRDRRSWQCLCATIEMQADFLRYLRETNCTTKTRVMFDVWLVVWDKGNMGLYVSVNKSNPVLDATGGSLLYMTRDPLTPDTQQAAEVLHRALNKRIGAWVGTMRKMLPLE